MHDGKMGKSSSTVRALTYCDLHKINATDIIEVLEMYPEYAKGFWDNLKLTYNLKEVRYSGHSGHLTTDLIRTIRTTLMWWASRTRQGRESTAPSARLIFQSSTTTVSVKITYSTFTVKDSHWKPFIWALRIGWLWKQHKWRRKQNCHRGRAIHRAITLRFGTYGVEERKHRGKTQQSRSAIRDAQVILIFFFK